MLFDFFKRKSDNIEEKSDILASISYSIKRDHKSPVLDIELSDFDDESTKALCSLLDTIGSSHCYLETIDMIKKCLMENQQEEILLKVIGHIASNAKNKLATIYKEKIKEEPCIRPSEVLK